MKVLQDCVQTLAAEVFKQMNGGQPHIHVYIEMDRIDSIVLMGASTADFNGKFSSDDVDIRMNGGQNVIPVPYSIQYERSK